MDSASISAASAARELGTSLPRVMRAIERLGFDARRGNGRMALRPDQVADLREALGVSVRVSGLTPIEVRVLVALRGAPLGLVSVRGVARRGAISPTAASRALKSLEGKDLVRRESTVIAAGRARRVELFHANRRAPRWMELAPLLERVRPPAHEEEQRDSHVPMRLRHLFWNTAPAQLEVDHAGSYIARRLLSTMDLDGLAWGAHNLGATAWRSAQKARGLDVETRALAHNLAAQAFA